MRTISRRRSLVKAVTYRAVIVCLDLATIYLLTGKATVALGFAVASNIYTTLGYIAHERVWAHIGWGIYPV